MMRSSKPDAVVQVSKVLKSVQASGGFGVGENLRRVPRMMLRCLMVVEGMIRYLCVELKTAS